MLRRRHAWAATTLAISAFSYGERADAGECAASQLNTCISSETYWPTAGPTRLLTVAGTETVPRSQVGFGLLASYLYRPVVLDIASPGPGGTGVDVVKHAASGNFLWAYGVTDRLQLDLALPVTFYQRGSGATPVTGGPGVRESTFRDLRFGTTFAIVPRTRVAPGSSRSGGAGHTWSLAARLAFSAPTGDRGSFSGDRTGVAMPSLAADYRRGRWFAGVDLGLRIRPVTQFAGARIGTQLTAGLGVGVDVLSKELLSASLEARTLYGFAEQHDVVQSALGTSSVPNGNRIAPSEWMLALRSAPIAAGDVSFHLGGGGPIPLGGSSPMTVPSFRAIFGVVYAPHGYDSDGDGIDDVRDRCPSQPANGVGPRDGCPHDKSDDQELAAP